MNVLGIDPGVVGAWAVCDSLGRLISAGDLPIAGEGTRRMVSGALFVTVLEQFAPARAVIERVGSMPGQGVSSTFKFGRAAGVVEGVIGARKVPISFVAPAVWKRHYGLSNDKEASRQLAIETWPNMADLLFARKKDHGKAEAALIALWGVRAAITSGEAA